MHFSSSLTSVATLFRQHAAKPGLMALALLGASAAGASGLLLPDEALREDLQWLSNRQVIQVNLSTWPLSQEEITRVLAAAKPQSQLDRDTMARVQKQVQELKSAVRAEAATSTDYPRMPQGFGQTETDQHRLSLIGQYNQHPDLDVRLQLNGVDGDGAGRSSKATAAGSYAAGKLGNQWIAFGQIPQWWGPGHEGSLIRGTSARPVTGFLMQRAEQTPFETPWLSWAGPWQYQITAGQLAQYGAVPDAKLLGMRLSVAPTEYLELGASRAIQWGGQGRPQSMKSLGKALLGKGDNEESSDKSNEPGNQLAGCDARLKLQPLIGEPISIYGQIVGEDEAGYLPSKNTYLLGIDGSYAWGQNNVNWYVEGADTTTELDRDTNITYRHHLYKDGFYQQGYPLAYSYGGDAQTITSKLTVSTPDRQRYSGKLIYAKVNPHSQAINQAYPNKDTLRGFEAGWGKTFNNGLQLQATAWVLDSERDNTDVGAGLKVAMPLR